MATRYVVDTNVLVYALDRRAVYYTRHMRPYPHHGYA